jgi:hypothetical protein
MSYLCPFRLVILYFPVGEQGYLANGTGINNRQTWPFSTLTIKNRDYVALSLALLVYRANENRKHCTLFSEVTQKDLKYIENFKAKTTVKK